MKTWIRNEFRYKYVIEFQCCRYYFFVFVFISAISFLLKTFILFANRFCFDFYFECLISISIFFFFNVVYYCYFVFRFWFSNFFYFVDYVEKSFFKSFFSSFEFVMQISSFMCVFVLFFDFVWFWFWFWFRFRFRFWISFFFFRISFSSCNDDNSECF